MEMMRGLSVTALFVLAAVACRGEHPTGALAVPESAYLGDWELLNAVADGHVCAVPCTLWLALLGDVRFLAGTVRLSPDGTMTQTLLMEVAPNSPEVITLAGTYEVVPHPRPTHLDDYPVLVLLRRPVSTSLSVAGADTVYMQEGQLRLSQKYNENICLLFCTQGPVPGYVGLQHVRRSPGDA